jgi:hypothetical protein
LDGRYVRHVDILKSCAHAPKEERLEASFSVRSVQKLYNGEQYGNLALQVGGVSDETVNYGVSSVGLRTESDCSGKVQKQL